MGRQRTTAHYGSRMTRSWLAALLVVAGAPAATASDLVVLAARAPNSGCALGDAEPVEIRVYNYGIEQPGASIYTLSFRVDGGPWIDTVVFMGNPIPTNGGANLPFGASTADLSAPGDHVIDVRVGNPADTNPGNNILSGHVVRNDAMSVGGVVTAPAVAEFGVATLGGRTGSVLEWQESPDGERWYTLENTSDEQGFDDLEAPTWFRAVVRNGRCPPVTSDAALVRPDALFSNGFDS
jgi:hypothetical protein